MVVGDNWGFLHWISKDDGAIEARYALGDDNEDESIYVAPIVVNEQLVAITRDGNLAALSLSSIN